MGAYLDRLNGEFDQITEGVTTILERAADDNRDLTDEEQTQVDREDARRQELTRSIEHYTEIDERSARVSAMRSRVPSQGARTGTTRVEEPAYDVLREFPTPAHYAIAMHRALVRRDPESVAAIERATAHQTTDDNPGVIPRPILGPVINLVNAARPLIASITNRPLPAGKFDRPQVTQHVDVQKQTAEKTLTASREMLITELPVTASTYAGHLNISRQNIKWSSPAILQIVFDDFAAMYALATDKDAATQFLASVTTTDAIASGDWSDLNGALYANAGRVFTASGVLPDTLWAAPDVWGAFGGMLSQPNGVPAFPSLSLSSTSGNPLGLRLVVDPNFPAGTLVMGASRFAEWYEDVDGLLQVQEPDVLGQMVGFAGYGAFLNTVPGAFTKLTGLPVPVVPLAASSSGSK